MTYAAHPLTLPQVFLILDFGISIAGMLLILFVSVCLCVDGDSRRGMGVELQTLAKEVARVETVRNYAGEFSFTRFVFSVCEFHSI